MIDINDILDDHLEMIKRGFASLDTSELDLALDAIRTTIEQDGFIYVCGNGASAAIANHMACDYTKGTKIGDYRPKVISLSSNMSLITAIANDISYDEIYSFQLDSLVNYRFDILVVISSSGNSPNIIKAIEKAQSLGITVIAFTGFDGGKAKQMADINIHVDVPEYEAIEDCHQAIMQVIAKRLRLNVRSE